MLAYLIKSILCLLVLWGFYKIALEQTAAHHFKRIYLLGSLVLALTLPLITFSYTVEVEPRTVVTESAVFEPAAFTETPVAAPVAEPKNWFLIGLGIVYVAGVLLFGFRFLRNLIRLRNKITSNEKVQAISHINVLLAGKVVPHSFLRFIFLPRKDFKKNTIAPEILAHEQAHVTQKHSWDILAVEFLQVIFWFNPLLVFLKRSVALNHEFLADRAALAQNSNTENYTQLLFTYSGGAHHTALSSPINYSLTKKRILMLSKTRSVKKLATRLALLVPVLALCVYFFNEEIVAKPANLQQKEEVPTQNDQNSDTLTDTYIQSDKPRVITQADLNAISKDPTYGILEKKSPTASQLNEWKDASQYGVWVDGKRINNASLKSSKDYSYYSISKLEKNAKNYGSHYYQVDLMTAEYYESHKKIQNPPTAEEVKTYLAQNEKVLNITVTGSQVWVNGKETSIENFAKDLDALSKDWTFSDKRNYSIHIINHDPEKGIWSQLQDAFQSTALYKASPKILLPPPPPPAPAAPNAGTPPPPPPTPASETKLSEEELIAGLEQDGKVISFKIEEDQILLNSKKVNIEDFVKEMNAITRGWTQDELKNCRVLIGKSTSNADPKLRAAVEREYKKTDLYQAQPTHGLIPPPPPPVPAAPNSATPPPPPPPPAPVSPALFNEENYRLLNIKLSKTDAIEIEGQKTTFSNVKTFIEKNFQGWTADDQEKPRGVIFHLPEGVSESQAQKAFKEIQDFEINGFTLKKEGYESKLTPPSTQEMVDMAKKNIFYNGEKISESKARDMVKDADQYDIQFMTNQGTPILFIKDKK